MKGTAKFTILDKNPLSPRPIPMTEAELKALGHNIREDLYPYEYAISARTGLTYKQFKEGVVAILKRYPLIKFKKYSSEKHLLSFYYDYEYNCKEAAQIIFLNNEVPV